MGAAMGRETDALAFFASLADAPYRHDFYQTLRRLECLYDTRPRWGEALRPIDEPVRLGQDPDLSFAPAPLASFSATDGDAPRLQVRLFGLFGPNGPMPLHVTEYVRDRLRLAGDSTLSRFFDLFHHRFLALFYRAWAQAQPHVSRDRPQADRFTVYVGSFLGMAPSTSRDRDALPDVSKFFHVGALIRHSRDAEGLTHILQHFFRVPVHIEEFVGHWMPLKGPERSALGHESAALGAGAVLGSRVWDRQHKFRVRLGPLTFAQYESFLPGGQLRKLVDWVRMYLSFELDWDVQLVLERLQVPKLTLGRGGQRLGWTTWLGERRAAGAADDLCLDAEAFAEPVGQAHRGERAA
jgi:type VI secretion system protein ImpH